MRKLKFSINFNFNLRKQHEHLLRLADADAEGHHMQLLRGELLDLLTELLQTWDDDAYLHTLASALVQ